jgi:hypothetical protein
MKNQNHFWNSAYVVGIVSFLCRAGLTALLLACVLGPAKAAERTPVDRSTVVFVCEHGAVKRHCGGSLFQSHCSGTRAALRRRFAGT